MNHSADFYCTSFESTEAILSSATSSGSTTFNSRFPFLSVVMYFCRLFLINSFFCPIAPSPGLFASYKKHVYEIIPIRTAFQKSNLGKSVSV